jgi:hypothetical protein
MAKIVTSLTARAKFQERLIFSVLLKPLRMFCNHCDKFIPSDIAWKCGHCDAENLQTKIYSFLNKCRRCKRSPKSFVCPHCNGYVFLDLSNDSSNPARDSNFKLKEPDVTEEEDHRRYIRGLEMQKFELEREIMVTRLNVELSTLTSTVKTVP